MKRWMFIFAMILLMTTISASTETLGVFQQNQCVDLIQSGVGFTSCNVTSVKFPNSTEADSDKLMTKDGVEYNYTFCNTVSLGGYIVNGLCTNGSESVAWAYDFEITYDGNTLDNAKSILYLGLIGILILLFVLVVIAIPRLPNGKVVNERGILIDINNLKYLRPVFYAVAWFLLLGIIFITSNISIAYLPTALFGEFFFMLFRIMMILSYPMILFFFIYMFVIILKDREVKRMIERGVEIGDI